MYSISPTVKCPQYSVYTNTGMLCIIIQSYVGFVNSLLLFWVVCFSSHIFFHFGVLLIFFFVYYFF